MALKQLQKLNYATQTSLARSPTIRASIGKYSAVDWLRNALQALKKNQLYEKNHLPKS